MTSYSAPFVLLAALLFLPSQADGAAAPSCTSGGCHDRPSSGVSEHEPYRDGSCLPCHEPGPRFDSDGHDSLAFTPWDFPAGLCDSCHEETAALVIGTPHGRAGDIPCLSCHRPHVSPFPFLLREDYPASSYLTFDRARYAICWECHDSRLATEKFTDRTGFRQGRRNFHYSHLHKRKGMTCRICHEPHDGRQAFLLRSTLSRSDAGWRGSMLFTPSREGGSCQGGCHKDLSYRR